MLTIPCYLYRKRKKKTDYWGPDKLGRFVKEAEPQKRETSILIHETFTAGPGTTRDYSEDRKGTEDSTEVVLQHPELKIQIEIYNRQRNVTH